VAEIHVTVGADVDGTLVAARSESAVIPPDYDEQDTEALIVRMIEDTAFRAVGTAFGRTSARRALLAHAARLVAIRDAYARMPRSGAFLPHINRIEAIYALTNDEVTEQWGSEDPEAGG